MIRILIICSSVLLLSTHSYSQEVSKDKWLEYMKEAVPATFCQAEQYFRQCFDIDGSGCIETARMAVDSCIAKEEMNLPDSLNAVTGERWGNIIGSCAGGMYEQMRHGDKRINPKCSNPALFVK